MNVVALPAFTDNYIWLLHTGDHAVVVDPGDADVVEQALLSRGLKLSAILVTHHHADHVGGVDALRQHWQCTVFGPASETIPEPYVPLREPDTVTVLGLTAEVLDVPGHTAGHIAYVLRLSEAQPWLFCGDTLFSAGCGRLFEGTPQQMQHSLSKFADLPAATRVFCTHEYTVSNLRFARAVEPDNPDIAAALELCTQRRAEGRITLPSTVQHELKINPFMRCTQVAVIESAVAQGALDRSPVAVFTALRTWKNRFV